MTSINLPSTSELRDALLSVLRNAQRELTTKEIDSLSGQLLNLTEEQLNLVRSGNRTEFAYRMAWERTHAKNKGLIEKVSARTWKIK